MKLKPDEKQIESYRYNFKKGKLGKGTCGTVYKGVDVRNNRAVAIKIIKKKDLCQAGKKMHSPIYVKAKKSNYSMRFAF